MQSSSCEVEEPRRSRHNSRVSHTRSSSTDSLLDQNDFEQQSSSILASQSTTSATPASLADNSQIEAANETQPSQASLTPLQVKFIIVLLVICNFLIANGVSLQGPFFPKEAESKGATPIIYSSIFAIYELVMLVTSFLFGNLVEQFKPNLMSGFGLTVTGLSTAVFGLLTYFNTRLYFVLCSFLLRITESLGATAFATSSYSFISACFPDQTATMFAVMETFFGLGVITGPVLGGFLYDIGGFLVPFLSVGIVMTFCGIILISHPVEVLFLRGKQNGQRKSSPEEDETLNEAENSQASDGKLVSGEIARDSSLEANTLLVPINESPSPPPPPPASITLWLFLSSPIVLLDSFIIITAITLMGFNGATLEPFLRHQQISSSTLYTSLMFVAIGASYAFSAMLWGKACDKYPKYLLHFAIFGSFLTTAGLVFIGPLPFLEQFFSPSLASIVFCLVLFGIGTASKQVAGYTHAMNYTIQKRKFPANQQTYGYISGMFFSCLSFGGFIGPIIGGSLVQQFSYQYATLVMWAIELVVMFILLCLQLCCPSFRL